MCRLMLMSSEKEITSCHYLVMSYMLALSERVGNTHGMGIGTNTDFIKFAENASAAVLTDEYIGWVQKSLKSPTHTLLGHTRLASGVFRKVAGDYKSDESHPFSFGLADSWGTVYHNGTFKEYELMAEMLKLPAGHGLTDTGIFAGLLGATVTDKVPSVEELVKLYEICGKAEYSMLITHNTLPDITVVRGNKPLYKAKSNYGLLINTSDTNIKDLPHVVNPGLKMMGYDLLKVETPIPMANWTVHKVLNGTITKVADIDELQKISDTPIVPIVTYHRRTGSEQTWQQGSMLKNSEEHNKEIDVKEVAERAEAMTLIYILALDGALGSEELDRIFSEVYEDVGPWFTYETARLTEVANLFAWTWTKFEKTQVTTEKLNNWDAFKKVCRTAGYFTAPSVYREANKLLEGDFVNPWFLNDPEDLNTLASLVLEVVFDESADNNWAE